MIVLSYKWETQMHIDPSGAKIRRLAEVLRRLGATDEEDGCFVDFCSLSQRGFATMPEVYFSKNGLPKPAQMADRTPLELAQFRFAYAAPPPPDRPWPLRPA